MTQTILACAGSHQSNCIDCAAVFTPQQSGRQPLANRLNIMREHIIRLRAGWLLDVNPDPRPDAHGERVSLPLVWPADVARRVWLTRFFQAPPIDLERESLGFRLEDVSGLVAAVLNQEELVRRPTDTAALWLPLPRGARLPRRNRLVLEVEPPRTIAGASPGSRLWGTIALVLGLEELGDTGHR